MYTIKELLPNTTYVIEIRAIGKHGRKRFRSRLVKLRIRTLALKEGKNIHDDYSIVNYNHIILTSWVTNQHLLIISHVK